MTANFCLAVRILSFFNVTPVCFPPIPDLRNHQLWHAFDLRLDVALLQMQSPAPVLSLSYRTFLEQSVQTLRHVTLADTPDISFPCQLTQLPTVLSTLQQQEGSCNLPVAGCEVLAAYIDKSVSAIRQVLMFPIVGPLFHLFPKAIGGDCLLLAMIKIVCFMPETRQILQHMCADVFGEFVELFAAEKPLFALMLAVFVLRDSPRVLETVNGRWADAILPRLANRHDDVRLWALVLLMTILPAVPDAHIALERVVRRLDDDCPAVRIAALQTLCCFPKQPDVVPAVAKLARDVDSLVRSQVAATLSKLPRAPKTDEAVALLRSDPSPDVRRETESYVYDWFLSSVLSPLNRLIREPEMSFVHVQGAPLVVERVRILPRKLDHLQSVQLTAQQSGPELPRVSSNLAMTSNGCLLFGCRDGEVCLVDQSAPRLCAVGQAPICHVHHTANYGYPITFASSADANMYVLKTGSELDVTNSFRLNEPCRMCECGPRNLYVVNAQSIAVYDLVKQKQLQNLSWTRPKVVRVASSFSDVVAIAGDCLEFFDTRVGYQNIAKYDGVRNIVDVFDIGANPYQFAVCHAKPVVAVVDLRRQQVQSHVQIAQDDVQTLSFSGQQGGSAVLIGTSRGVCLFDYVTGSKVEKSSASAGLLFQKKITGASRCAFDPSRFRFAVLNEDGELITVVGELKPET
jgi:hypothetical protein